ncbi:MAG: glycosyltransferase family 61 protein [Chloroflexi bacterium]|nr:glycosyltransferase family 61 protein [Chloroflexota bacterium]MBV9599106.1 glycosyltransferase family 61 protein [Chloroflexota bacterium]
MLDEDKRVCYEAVYGPFGDERDPATRYVVLPPAVRLQGNWTSIVGWWTGAFHHWFMDALPRLALLSEFPNDTHVLGPGPLLRYQAETLAWMDLTDRYRPTTAKHVIVEDFYFAPPTVMMGGSDPDAVAFLRGTFLGMADATYDPPRRFFLHRVGRRRGLANESEVVDYFREHDWAVIDPESLTLAQQIKLFASAEVVCGLHGGGLTNLLWCQPGCRVYELLASNYLNGVFEGLAALVGAKHHFAVFPGSGDFKATIDLRELNHFLKAEGV